MAAFLYILFSMTAVNHVLGASLSISGSSSYAVLNQPFTLTCTVTQAAGLSDKVQFLKKTTSNVFVSIKQNGGSCSLFSRPPSGYTPSCGSGTDSSSSTTKKYTLRINRAAERDATDWWCDLVTATTRSNTFSLQISNGPNSVQLNTTSPLRVKAGDDVSVSCDATNCSPSCSFTWKFKSQINPSSSVLSLNNIQRSAAGDYTCTARNTYTQKSLDKTITVDVQYSSSIASLTLNSQSTKVTVDELTPMTLRCNVTSNPESHIKLMNNSQTLHEVTDSKQAEYMWNEAGCLDTGHYTCEAGNNIKLSVSESVQLVVRCSPRLDHRVPFQKEFVAALDGDRTMEISVIANPTPTFTWYKLTDGNKNRLGFGSSSTTDVSAVGKLTLTNIQQRHIGTYQVVVANGAKNTDLVESLTLDVAGPPNIPSHLTLWSNLPHSISVAWIGGFNGGSEQIFSVQYRADTTSQWTNLTEVIPEIGGNTIQNSVIPNLQQETRYLVRVLAYNKYGYKGFTKEQEVLTSPSDPSLLPVSSNKVTGEGIAVGITIGIALAALVVAVFVIFRRRGYVCVSSKPDGQRTKTNVHQHTSLEETRRGDSNEPGISNEQINTYEGLEMREATPYAKLELYENLNS